MRHVTHSGASLLLHRSNHGSSVGPGAAGRATRCSKHGHRSSPSPHERIAQTGGTITLCHYALLATLLGPAAHAETTTRLDAIVGGGTLRVGLTDDRRPFSFADASGKVEGIDVDTAMSSAQSLGVRLEVVKTSADSFPLRLSRLYHEFL
jgi:hypothetical protein